MVGAGRSSGRAAAAARAAREPGPGADDRSATARDDDERADGGAPVVEVRRSARRRRTVSAHREGDRFVVLVPARLSPTEERRWVQRMVDRLSQSEARRRPSDAELMDRATALSQRYLGGRAVPRSVRWSTNQQHRWGSCTPADGTVRISERAKGLPGWVLDYVVLHELAHLLVASHGPDFWAVLEDYPRLERARGFLEGFDTAVRGGHDETDPDDGVELDEPLPDPGG